MSFYRKFKISKGTLIGQYLVLGWHAIAFEIFKILLKWREHSLAIEVSWVLLSNFFIISVSIEYYTYILLFAMIRYFFFILKRSNVI